MDPSEAIVVYRNAYGRQGVFGDSLLSAQCVAILNDQGIPAMWWDEDASRRGLVDVPLWDGQNRTSWYFNYQQEHVWDGRSILRKALDNFSQDTGHISLEVTRPLVPVRFAEDPSIHGVDVVICSECGPWSKYREYPQMAVLKRLLSEEGLEWIDLSERGIRDNAALNWVRKSRLYLGLETGMSHYVAGHTQRAMILQSGYSDFSYWASTYPYQGLFRDVSCRRCFLQQGCPNSHACMDFPPVKVLEQINALLAT